MTIIRTIAGAAAAVALAATPALAQGGPPSHAKAYGKYCQNQLKTHVAGQKGTPFSQCVTAMAHADKSDSTSARTACKALSKKHVSGQKRTPFSKCVAGVAQMRKDQQQSTAS
ncbi:MAG: hypothetical protein ACXVFN_13030 [Solirubrobacteraceae bacterium]